MSCCGKKRSQARLTTQTSSVSESAESASVPRLPEYDSQAYFQYLGKTGLTLMGPRTGKRYRLDRPGAVIAVDLRDRRALAAVSILRQVAKPKEASHPG